MGKLRFKTRCFLDIKIGDESVGRIVVELFDDLCPKATDNFKKLCQGICGLGIKTGKPLHYQGSCFHRVIKGFMIQGGDFSKGDGTGGESTFGGTFADENLETPHDQPFLLSMANRGPNTNGSQFFITTAPAPHLNGKHVVFGHVFSGFEVVAKIEDVAIADTRSHKPLKPVIIENCGELIPVKKEKSKKEEKELKNKRKKDKKQAKISKRRAKSSKTDDEDSDGCKIRPEEIPDVPMNKFLYRSDSRPSNLSDNIPLTTTAAFDSVNIQTKKTVDKYGRITKGRGKTCYERENTPPHWRQASQRMRKLNPEDSRKWHDGKHNRKHSRERRASPYPEHYRSSHNDPAEYPIRSQYMLERNKSSPSEARNRSPSPTIESISNVIYHSKIDSPVKKRPRESISISPTAKRNHMLETENAAKNSRSYSEDSDGHRKSPQLMIRRKNSNLVEKRHVIETDDGYVVNVQTNKNYLLAERHLIDNAKLSSSKRKGSVTPESPTIHYERRGSRRVNDSPRKDSTKMLSPLDMDQSPVRRKSRRSIISQHIPPSPSSKSTLVEVPRHESSKERGRHSSLCSSSSSNRDSRNRIPRGRQRSPTEDTVRPKSQVTRRSPPQHLVDKWRERKERRSGARGPAPCASVSASRGRRHPSYSRSVSSASHSRSRSPSDLQRNHSRHRNSAKRHPASSHSRSPLSNRKIVTPNSTLKDRSPLESATVILARRTSSHASSTDKHDPPVRESSVNSLTTTSVLKTQPESVKVAPLLPSSPAIIVDSLALLQNGNSEIISKSLIEIPKSKVKDLSCSRWDVSPTVNDVAEIPVPPTTDEISLSEIANVTSPILTDSIAPNVEEKQDGNGGIWTTSRWCEDDLTSIVLPPSAPLPLIPTSEIKLTVAALSTSNTGPSSALKMKMSDSEVSSPPHLSKTSVLERLRAAEQKQKTTLESLSEEEKNKVELNLGVSTEKNKEKAKAELPPTSIGVQLKKKFESNMKDVEVKNGSDISTKKETISKLDHLKKRKLRKESSASYSTSTSSNSSSGSDSDSSRSSYSSGSHSSSRSRSRSPSRCGRRRSSYASSSSSIKHRRRRGSRHRRRGSSSFQRNSRYVGTSNVSSWSSNRRGAGGSNGRNSRRGDRGRSRSRSSYDRKRGGRRHRSSSRSS